MPTLITVAGADFSANTLTVVPPSIAGLKVWAPLGMDLAHSQNLVPGGPTMSVVGNPGYGVADILFTPGTNYFDTGLTLTTGGTIIVAASMLSSAGISCLFGNYVDSTHGLEVNLAASGVFPTGFQPPNNLNSGMTGAVIQVPGLYSLSFGNNVAPLLKAMTIGTASAIGSVPGSNYDMVAQTLKLGGSPAPGGNTAACKIAFVAVYQDVALTSSQIDSLVPSIRATLAARGITV